MANYFYEDRRIDAKQHMKNKHARIGKKGKKTLEKKICEALPDIQNVRAPEWINR